MRVLPLLGCLFVLSACATAPAPPPEVMAEATRVILTETEWPAKGDEATRWVRQKVLVPIDATPNAERDWMIDPGRSETAGMLCGTGGCELQVWSRAASGTYVPVFVSQVRQFEEVHKGGVYRVRVDYHGTYCGLAGAESCPATYVWHGDMSQLGTDPEVGFHLELPQNQISPAPLTQAVTAHAIMQADMPAPLSERLSQAQTACAQRGRSFVADGIVNRLPDTNGDGIREWAWDGLYAQCSWEADSETLDDPCAFLSCENYVYVSQTTADGSLQWVPAPLEPGSAYGLQTCKAGLVEIVELDPDHAAPIQCDCSSQCVKKVLPPIPNTVN